MLSCEPAGTCPAPAGVPKVHEKANCGSSRSDNTGFSFPSEHLDPQPPLLGADPRLTVGEETVSLDLTIAFM